MIYTSKRRKFKDFVKTHNWKYYLLFLIIFITVVVTVVIMANKDNKKPQIVDDTTPFASETDTTDNNETKTTIVKGKYRISINLANNIISIFEWDNSTENYSDTPIKRIPSAADKSLKEGVYTFTKDNIQKKVWYTDDDNNYSVRYYSCFNDIKFHSAMYSNEGDRNSLKVDSYNLINGASQSDDGIILLCTDAKWIYENCSYASEVVVYTDETEESGETFEQILAVPEGITWEPTDTSEDSPYCPTQVASFNCVYELFETVKGAGISVLYPYIQAVDVNGNDVRSYIYTDFDDKFTEAGVFKVEFRIADIYGTVMKDHFMVTVIDMNNSDNTEESDGTEDNTEKSDNTEDSNNTED